jgi:hypothetical protein
MRWLMTMMIPALVSCGGQIFYDWHGDRRFTPEERAAIVEGETWLAKHAHRTPAVFDWTYDVTGETPNARTIQREAGPHGETGFCTAIGSPDGAIYLNPDDPNSAPNSLDGLAAHELAHCELGFVDDPMTDGIMRVVTPKRWTEREDEQCHVTTACGPR